MKTAADSRVAVVTQLTLAVEVPRSLRISPRIGTGRVCIIDTTMAARLRAKTMTVSFLCRASATGVGAAVLMGGGTFSMLQIADV
ncbi:hypothetical protein [Streptomyces sp. NBC_00879]|uniref:hypothetical protein n=1 Tax=Streptomyces sp. NBC_00879 TaxID=2975855 RepID=UPI0038652020